MIRSSLAIMISGLAMCACSNQEVASVPDPVTLTEEAAGHYCQMNVLAHAGPKAQIHLSGNPFPLFFTQVRDAFAFDRMPEEEAEVTAIYVNDMGAEHATWDDPGVDNWIAAVDAHYVEGSDRRGGMGAPELIPFSDREMAQSFADRHGGTVMAYGDISDDLVLAPVEVVLGDDSSSHDRRQEAGQPHGDKH